MRQGCLFYLQQHYRASHNLLHLFKHNSIAIFPSKTTNNLQNYNNNSQVVNTQYNQQVVLVVKLTKKQQYTPHYSFTTFSELVVNLTKFYYFSQQTVNTTTRCVKQDNQLRCVLITITHNSLWDVSIYYRNYVVSPSEDNPVILYPYDIMSQR